MMKTDSWFYWEDILSYCFKGRVEEVTIYMNTDISIFLHHHSKRERICKEEILFIRDVLKYSLSEHANSSGCEVLSWTKH